MQDDEKTESENCVASKEELTEHIYQYFNEINAEPVVYHWTYKMDEIKPDEV